MYSFLPQLTKRLLPFNHNRIARTIIPSRPSTNKQKLTIKRQHPNPFHNLSSSSNSSLLTHRCHQILHRLSRLHTNTLLAQQINKQGRRTVVLAYTSGVHGLVRLVALHVLDVHVEEVGGVHWTAFGFGVELGGEDGAGFVDHA
jgi:hypothetical protein